MLIVSKYRNRILLAKEAAVAAVAKSHILYGNAFTELKSGHGARVRFYEALKSPQL